MAYIVARVTISEGEEFPRLGDSLFLARAELRDSTHYYEARRESYEDAEGRQKLFGLLGYDGTELRHAFGMGRVVTLKKVSYSRARISSTVRLMRLMIDGPVHVRLAACRDDVFLE